MIGKYPAKLDEKNRLFVPAKLRGFVCTCGELLHDQMTCPKCARHFEPDGEGLREVK